MIGDDPDIRNERPTRRDPRIAPIPPLDTMGTRAVCSHDAPERAGDLRGPEMLLVATIFRGHLIGRWIVSRHPVDEHGRQFAAHYGIGVRQQGHLLGRHARERVIVASSDLPTAQHHIANANTSHNYLHLAMIGRSLLRGSSALRLEIPGLRAVLRGVALDPQVTFVEESQMKTAIMPVVKGGILLASVFAPFLVLLGALFLLPHGIFIGKSPNALDWMWLILCAGMMLGIYFLTVGIAMGDKRLTH